MHKLATVLSLGTALAAATGCADSMATPEMTTDGVEAVVTGLEKESSSVARIDFADGRQFEFLEFEPGAISLNEIGPVGVRPTAARVNLNGLTSLEAFKAILPDAEPPAALVQANKRELARMDEAKRKGPNERRPSALERAVVSTEEAEANALEEENDEADPLSGLTDKAIDDRLCPNSWFRENLCMWVDGMVNFQTCQSYRTTNGNFQRNDVATGSAVTCVYKGTVNLRVRTRRWYDWDTKLNVNIPQGYYNWNRHVEGYFDFDYEAHSTPTAGSGYHYSGFASEFAMTEDRYLPPYPN